MASTNAEKPVIVIVHGAFHYPAHYRKLITQLRGRGYTVLVPALPSAGLDDSVVGKTHLDDVKRIHESLLPYLDAGRQAVLLCHSQGGVPGSAATEGQTVAERKSRGLEGGIKRVVYLAAFALPDRGTTVLQAIGGKPAPFWGAEDERVGFTNEGAGAAFTGMLSKGEQEAVVATLVGQSWASYNAPIDFVAKDVSVPKTYILTTEDVGFPMMFQKMWSAASGCETVEIKSDHSPFMADDRTEMVVDIVDKVAKI